MPTKTKIEWADYISNPIKARHTTAPYPMLNMYSITKIGHVCAKLSTGCANCWASRFNTRLGTGLAYVEANLEKVTLLWDEAEAARLLKFKPKGPFKNGRSRPLVFPCDMTDAFGDWVPVEYLKKLWTVMEARPDVDFLLLTKRSARMVNFAAGSQVLPNVYLGVSVEDQASANDRGPNLQSLSARGWKTVISYEPALGQIDWEWFTWLDGLICGGESGPNARPMSPDWARAAQRMCAYHQVPFFFKQWGEYLPVQDCQAAGMQTFKHCPVNVSGRMMAKVGRGLAGHTLDGETYRAMA